MSVVRGLLRCVGLGLCAAALEMVWHAVMLPAELPLASMGGLSASVAAVDGGLFLAIGLVLSPLLLRRSEDLAIPGAQHLGATAFLGVATFVVPPVRQLLASGNTVGAVIVGALPFEALLLVYFGGRWLLRRTAAGEPAPPFAAVALALHLVTSVLCPVIVGIRQPIGDPVDARHLVLITVDGLGAGDEGPAWLAFADEGIRFRQAVAASPISRPSNASALVGLHPIRTKVIDDQGVLARGYTSAFEVLQDIGFATGAFVSSATVASGSGLEQGFGTYEDTFVPAWQRVVLASRFVQPTGHRSASETVDAFEAWFDGRYHRPFAVWLHLADPALAPGDPAATQAVDDAVARVRELLASHDLLERTSVVLAGTSGPGGRSALVGIGDDRVHVPLVLRVPERPQIPVVDAQVRLVDVASTVLDAVELPGLDQSEGVALGAYGTGLRRQPMNATLLGLDEKGQFLLGVRNNGLKFALWHDGRKALFSLERDPFEQHDIAAEQEKTVQTATMLLSRERAALDALEAGAD